MGVVYLARNRLLERREVLKVVNQDLLARAGGKERFLREIQSAARLSHPNVVTAYTALQLGGLLVFAMEYVEGQDLAQLVKAHGPLPVANACYYAQQAALGLQHACDKHMVHRDIKPQNLILARVGKKHVVKVLDFGLAKVVREKAEESGLTGAGKMLGTPDYIAPEQTLDAARADIRADIYSLGCTLYFLLTGAPPFRGNSLYAVLQAHHTEEAVPLNAARPEVPVALAAVVAKMMAKDPAQRYQKPAEVAQALAPFLKPTGKGLPTSGAPGPGTPPAAPHVPPARDVASRRPEGAEETITPSVRRRETMAEATAPVSLVKRPAVRPGPPPARKGRKSAIALGVAIGAVLPACLLGLWVGGVFRVRTQNGVLVLQVNEANPDVFVDGERVTVSWGADGKQGEIQVKPGTRLLTVTKDGFTAHGETVALEDGGRRVVTATLESAPAGTGQRRPPAGFVPLFNGKDLRGWLIDGGNAKDWGVSEGELIGWGQDSRTRSYLLTERAYADFRLRLEFNLARGAGGGIALRALRGEKMPLKGMIFDHPLFKLIDNRGAEETGTTHWVLNTTSVAPSQSAETYPAGTWNRLEIEVRGRSLAAWVNGKQVVNTTLAEGALLADGGIPALNRPRGRVGLQKHTGTVRFRNIAIKELPSTADSPKKAAKGFPVIIPEKDRGKWCVADGCLEQTSPTDRVWITFGDPSWKDYDHSVEFCSSQAKGTVLVAFRLDWEKQVVGHPARACVFGLNQWHNAAQTLEGWLNHGKWHAYAQRKGTLPADTWMRARVSVRGGRAQCFLNDRKLFDSNVHPHLMGCVGLMTFGGHHRFRNIQVTDPEGKVLLQGLPDLESAWSAN
jgi:hypothetical protein